MAGGGSTGNPGGASNPMGGTGSSVPGTMNQGGYMVNQNPAYGSGSPSTPQWLKGRSWARSWQDRAWGWRSPGNARPCDPR